VEICLLASYFRTMWENAIDGVIDAAILVLSEELREIVKTKMRKCGRKCTVHLQYICSTIARSVCRLFLWSRIGAVATQSCRNRLELHYKYNMRKYWTILCNRKDVKDCYFGLIILLFIINANLCNILLLIPMSVTYL
jgi:hypothetical protein